MKGRLLSHHDVMVKIFKDNSEFSVEYLSHTLKNNNPHIFMKNLQRVLEARVGSLSAIAKKTKLSKKQLEYVFSDEVNPVIDTMIKLFNVLDLQFTIPAADLVKKIKKPVASKTKKRVVSNRKKAILPPAIKAPTAEMPNLARKAKATQPPLKIRRAKKK